ncbi:MAG: PqqD family protein [Dorea sp.]|nr:PqqD family protein [Dorea sp.]
MKKYKIKPGFVPRYVAGEYLAIPVTMEGACRRQMILLNSVSAYIWELLENLRSLEELAGKIEEEFEITYPEAYQDTKAFLEDLDHEQLLYERKTQFRDTKQPDEDYTRRSL